MFGFRAGKCSGSEQGVFRFIVGVFSFRARGVQVKITGYIITKYVLAVALSPET